jgi:hypothetical protein
MLSTLVSHYPKHYAKFTLIWGVDLYRLLFFVSELLILHSDEYHEDNYTLTLV